VNTVMANGSSCGAATCGVCTDCLSGICVLHLTCSAGTCFSDEFECCSDCYPNPTTHLPSCVP
jgi:hypothetical protein